MDQIWGMRDREESRVIWVCPEPLEGKSCCLWVQKALGKRGWGWGERSGSWLRPEPGGAANWVLGSALQGRGVDWTYHHRDGV